MWSPGLRGRSVHSKEGGGGSRTDQVPPSLVKVRLARFWPQISEEVNALPAPVHFPPLPRPRARSRRGEIVCLTWNQISWESKVLRIDPPTEDERTKGEDARVIPFAKTSLEGLLKERWKQRDGSLSSTGTVSPCEPFTRSGRRRASEPGWRDGGCTISDALPRENSSTPVCQRKS